MGFCRNFKDGFTLAEVLITLGIIGVVAALTIPSVIEKHQKQKVEAQIKKFYANINNAVKMSTVDNGDVTLWMPEVKAQSYEQTLEFMQTYILPYLRYDKYYKCNLNEADRVCVQFLDGTVFTIKTDVNGTDIGLYLNGKLERNTRNYFAFQLNKRNTAQYSQTSYIEPYIYLWNGKVESLKQGQFRCSKDNNNLAGYCTKIIQLNGWKIPDDYPW